MTPKRKKFYIAMFLCYLLGLLWVLFARSQCEEPLPYWDHVMQHTNLIPFRTIALYWRLLVRPVRPVLTQLAIYNLVGNVLLFLPMGALLPTLFPKLRSLRKTLLVVTGSMVLVEVCQVLFLTGSCDIDDIILNLVGTALGYPLYRILTAD